MAETAPETDANPRFDPDDFGRRVREFASDAQRILTGPDGSIDELIELHSRVWFLLWEASGSQSSAIGRWLLATQQTIAAKLQAWSVEDMESLVA